MSLMPRLHAALRAHRLSALAAPTALAAALLAAQPAQADTYDLATDFSSVNGGSSPWSYGWNPDDGAGGYTFVPLDIYSSSVDAMSWNSATHNALGTPGIWKNLTATTWFGAESGQVSLHPAEAQSSHAVGNAVIVRFTVPVAGNYTFYSAFFVGDWGQTEAWVVRNGDFAGATSVGIVNGLMGVAFNTDYQSGDTIDFVVGHANDDFFGDNTPVSVLVVSSVPEPSPGALLAAGVLGLAWLRRRRT